jgi:hypothetical protein
MKCSPRFQILQAVFHGGVVEPATASAINSDPTVSTVFAGLTAPGATTSLTFAQIIALIEEILAVVGPLIPTT